MNNVAYNLHHLTYRLNETEDIWIIEIPKSKLPMVGGKHLSDYNVTIIGETRSQKFSVAPSHPGTFVIGGKIVFCQGYPVEAPQGKTMEDMNYAIVVTPS